ncbi:ATP-dependent nuclease [Pedobacter sp. WC2501]|uniref:ATP-dependent nuclease n=1 Tax=Pedobacter sp. WC2501 TaxID=3461400 RepID=UPI0040451CC7
MVNLRLINTEEQAGKIHEFYAGNVPVSFLSGLQNINIIVGANNTRKSRFLRSIINIGHKILIESKSDINVVLSKKDEILSDIEFCDKHYPQGMIQFQTFHGQSDDGNQVNDFLGDFKKHNRIVTYQEIMVLVNSISEELLSFTEGKTFETIVRKVKQLDTILRSAIYMYAHFRNNGNKVVHFNSYPASQLRDLGPSMPAMGISVPLDKLDEVQSRLEEVLDWTKAIDDLSWSKYNSQNIYIPALRSSRQLTGVSSSDVFEDILRDNYFKGTKAILQIETGLKLYQNINYARNGNRDEIRNFHAFEKFIGQTFFDSDDIHIIAYRARSGGSDVIKISLPDELEDIPMYDLGEGVQSIINLLFPIFTAEDGKWIYIDEPENHLHPGFQNIFVKAITQNEYLKAKNLRYFINTHSNHILSESFLSGSGTGIFVFSKRDENASNIAYFDQNQYKTLELLGVMNTSVLITNCSVWVEGVTDRFYLRAFLHAFVQQLASGSYAPSEGYDFSFVEYGGKNLVHYDFDSSSENNIAAYFINSNVFLLADSDFDSAKHVKYEERQDENFMYRKTDLPEIENLLPDSILKDFLLEAVKCDPGSLEGIFPIKHSSKLGKIFSGVMRNKKPVQIMARTGGTLSSAYKSKLAQFVHENILSGRYSWDELATLSTLKLIVEDLYGFIKNRNRRS